MREDLRRGPSLHERHTESEWASGGYALQAAPSESMGVGQLTAHRTVKPTLASAVLQNDAREQPLLLAPGHRNVQAGLKSVSIQRMPADPVAAVVRMNLMHVDMGCVRINGFAKTVFCGQYTRCENLPALFSTEESLKAERFGCG
jgi:hypothetical protein